MIYRVLSAAMLALIALSTLAAEEKPGRRLALLAGVGAYQDDAIPDLKAPPRDVETLRRVLTDANGYGFKEAHVVALVDEAATLAAFREAFQRLLIEEARPEDVVVIYFSGHGSQVCDSGGDEPDGKDESLVFFDSRPNGDNHLIDDELRSLINRIPAQHVTAIIDACHSGSSTKDPEWTGAKWLDGAECDTADDGSADAMLGAEEDHPGLIVISAVADDARTAYERGGASVLTAALAAALAEPVAQALTYEQLAPRVRQRAWPHGQTVSFQGALAKTVLGDGERRRPIAWIIEKTEGAGATAAGVPMPGWSPGGLARIYEAGAAAGDFADPGKAKAVMRIVTSTGSRADLALAGEGSPAGHIQPGDYAVLARPGEDLYQIKIRLALDPAAVKRARRIEESLRADERLAGLARLVDEPADFEIRGAAEGPLSVYGPEGKRRLETPAGEQEGAALAWNLWLHALQRHLLQLGGAGGKRLAADALALSLVPQSRQPACYEGQSIRDLNGVQSLPPCLRYRIQVEYKAGKGREPVQIGGLVLSSDGAVFGFPTDGLYPVLKPGEIHVFNAVFEAGEPFGLDDHLLVFGFPPDSPVYWHLFNHPATAGDGTRHHSGFQAILDMLTGDRRDVFTRGQAEAWATDRLTVRVLPPRSDNAAADGAGPDKAK